MTHLRAQTMKTVFFVASGAALSSPLSSQSPVAVSGRLVLGKKRGAEPSRGGYWAGTDGEKIEQEERENWRKRKAMEEEKKKRKIERLKRNLGVELDALDKAMETGVGKSGSAPVPAWAKVEPGKLIKLRKKLVMQKKNPLCASHCDKVCCKKNPRLLAWDQSIPVATGRKSSSRHMTFSEWAMIYNDFFYNAEEGEEDIYIESLNSSMDNSESFRLAGGGRLIPKVEGEEASVQKETNQKEEGQTAEEVVKVLHPRPGIDAPLHDKRAPRYPVTEGLRIKRGGNNVFKSILGLK